MHISDILESWRCTSPHPRDQSGITLGHKQYTGAVHAGRIRWEMKEPITSLWGSKQNRELGKSVKEECRLQMIQRLWANYVGSRKNLSNSFLFLPDSRKVKNSSKYVRGLPLILHQRSQVWRAVIQICFFIPCLQSPCIWLGVDSYLLWL